VTSFYFETVGSGEFFVGKTNQKIYKAFLGSCIGVVLIDKTAGIAGLYHILLPEPPGKGAVQESEKYASTGMPLFLEAMYNAGAKRENITAYVGGGALVGSVSLLDLRLDIGGQTAEVVEKYLALEKVIVKQIETGGYLASQVTLDMAKLECVIEPIISQHHLFYETSVEKKEFDLNTALEAVRPIPQIALKVIRMINSPSDSLSHIAEEVKQDQVLTGKVLQLSNSAYISPGRKIESIDKALVFLGEKRVLLLTLSVFTEIFYQQADQGYSLIKGGLFRHALGVAYVAEKIAKLTKIVKGDHAYTAGLLHDIGKTVLDQFLASDYPLFYRKVLEDVNRPLLQVEKELFGYSHTELGEKLSVRWGLPDSLTEAIAYHHHPEKSKAAAKLTNITFLANTLFSAFRSGVSLNIMDSISLEENLKSLNLNHETLKEIIDNIEWNKMESLNLMDT